jgi:hypothetical protein
MPLYTLARTTFPRKADAEKRVRKILHTTPLGQRLIGGELRLLLGVLAKHPRADEKLKGGIVGITVGLNTSDTGMTARGFQLVRPDGSYTPFLIFAPLEPMPLWPEVSMRQPAMRLLIQF